MRKILLGVAVLAALVVAGGIVMGRESLPVQAGTSIIYSNLPDDPIPGNIPSLGYQATQTSEFGSQVMFDGTERHDPVVTVLMSSWACESGHWSSGDCVTEPGATFQHPITLNIYEANLDDTVGSLIISETVIFDIPYRPSADNSNCTNGKWWDGENCNNGYANLISFNLEGEELPEKVVIGISYNTSNYGPDPIGSDTECNSTPEGCPYDSLNVGTNPLPSVGYSLPDSKDAYLNTLYASNYCDGGLGGIGTFRLDNDCWTDYLPAFKVEASTEEVEPTGEILAPDAGEVVSGIYTLEANYYDGDDTDEDIAYWAVREGGCSGVDVFSWKINDALDWDGEYFSYDIDTTTVKDGKYCFVWNPNSSADNVRDTVMFTIENDADDDGSLDPADICEMTVPDEPSEELGVNRYVWYEGENFTTLVPGKKGTFSETSSSFSIVEYTHGCSCTQILDMMTEAMGQRGVGMEGHYKFGCSKSVMEEFPMFLRDIEDGEYDGYYCEWIDQVSVPGTSGAGADSTGALELGKDYLLKASGIFTYTGSMWADAEWYLKGGVPVKGDLEGSKPYVLDTSIGGYSVNRDWGAYNPDHVYWMDFVGEGSPVHFSIYDSAYTDNSGAITVDICEVMHY